MPHGLLPNLPAQRPPPCQVLAKRTKRSSSRSRRRDVEERAEEEEHGQQGEMTPRSGRPSLRTHSRLTAKLGLQINVNIWYGFAWLGSKDLNTL